MLYTSPTAITASVPGVASHTELAATFATSAAAKIDFTSSALIIGDDQGLPESRPCTI